MQGLSAGAHLFNVRATLGGNQEDPPAQWGWQVVTQVDDALVTQGPSAPSDLGAFSQTCTGVASLQIRNDLPLDRTDELAFSGVPVALEQDLRDVSSLVLVGPGERRLQAQFTPLSRWGGAPDDAAVPIAWLEVAVKAAVLADSTSRYSLRRCMTAPQPASDPNAVTLEAEAATGRVTVRTGAATFVLNPQNAAVVESIRLGANNIYTDQAGAGPRLVARSGGAVVAQVDPQGFAVERGGPVSAVVVSRGHFVGGTSECGADPSYTVRMTFVRGSPDIRMALDFVNECGDGFNAGVDPNGAQWFDSVYGVNELAWVWPFAGFNMAQTTHVATSGAAVQQVPAHPGITRVAQLKGAVNNPGNTPWRQAEVSVNGTALESMEQLPAPLVALWNGQMAASIQMPWMRFREPQALVATGTTLEMHFIHEPFLVGEAQGIWGTGHLRLTQDDLSLAEPVRALATAGMARLERGLLVHAPVTYTNLTGVFPPLPTNPSAPAYVGYVSLLNNIHDATVADDGQWSNNKNYGLTSWPDVQFDQWPQMLDSPEDFTPESNYWSPTQSELLQWFVDGDPRWVWEFSWPQEQTQLKTNYYNLGTRNEQPNNIRGGFVAAVGAAGEGYRYRAGYGSDDYTYNQGSDEAYLVRPDGSMLERFHAAADTFIRRYNIPAAQEDQREQYVSQLVVARQVIQHVNGLRYAAAYGAADNMAREKLEEVMREYARDNLLNGTFCEDDAAAVNTSACGFASSGLFHYASLWHDTFWSYSHSAGQGTPQAATIRTALARTAQMIHQLGLPRSGGQITVDAPFANSYTCDFQAGGLPSTQCQAFTCNGFVSADDCFDVGGEPLYDHAKAQTLALTLLGQLEDPTLGACADAAPALAQALELGEMDDYYGAGGGWWKGAGLAMHNVVHGVGMLEVCGQ